jgi:hypothetical protein
MKFITRIDQSKLSSDWYVVSSFIDIQANNEWSPLKKDTESQ